MYQLQTVSLSPYLKDTLKLTIINSNLLIILKSSKRDEIELPKKMCKEIAKRNQMKK